MAPAPTTPEDKKDVLPGPKAKQAEALFQNIRWLVDTFGIERVGFLTLTVGDINPETGIFEKVKDRAEASRRFNSLATHVLKRYWCGVTVSERHKDGGIHFHLVVVCDGDIRTGLDMAACFPPKGRDGRYAYMPDYRTAGTAIRAEWEFWRDKAPAYGFGRANLQPVKKTGEAVARYCAKYISKTWAARRPEDKGARLVRYFGRWRTLPDDAYLEAHYRQGNDKKMLKAMTRPAPPVSCRFGTTTPRARAWRACCKQVEVVTAFRGDPVTPENVKEKCGKRWSWRFTKNFRGLLFVEEDGLPERTLLGLKDHNAEVLAERGEDARHICETPIPLWVKDPHDVTGEPTFDEWQAEKAFQAYCEQQEGFEEVYQKSLKGGLSDDDSGPEDDTSQPFWLRRDFPSHSPAMN